MFEAYIVSGQSQEDHPGSILGTASIDWMTNQEERHVSRKYWEASRTELIDRKFACSHCGYSARVEVLSKGSGRAQESSFVQHDAAREAVDNAHYQAGHNATVMVKLAPCPQCGRRNRSEVRWFLFSTTAKGIGIAIFFLISSIASGWFPSLGWCVIALLAGLVVSYGVAVPLQWFGSRRRIQITKETTSTPSKRNRYR